jgi:hypothetical protein
MLDAFELETEGLRLLFEELNRALEPMSFLAEFGKSEVILVASLQETKASVHDQKQT